MPLTIDELRPLLSLGLVEGIGPNRLAELVARFGDADRAMAAREPELRAIPGIGPRLARRIREAGSEESRTRTERALRTLERLDAFAMVAPCRQAPLAPGRGAAAALL